MEILQYFKAKGYTIYVLSTGPKEDLNRLNELGYNAIDVGTVVVNPFKALNYLISLVREIKKINPQIIFSFTIRPNIFGSIVARYLGKKIVSNVTGTGPLIVDNSMLYKTIRLIYKFAFTANQCVFFQNKDDYDYFLTNKYVKDSQAKLLPGSGVDTNYYLPIEKKSDLPFSFLMISRLIKDKGVVEFIEAARIVKKKYPEVKFQILGPFWTQSIGKNTITKQEMGEWIAEGIVEYLGVTNDVRPYIADSNCIVLPSYREGCANVLMQGASMERPLIASDVTGCNNLIEDEVTGYVFLLRNVEKLVNSLLRMIELPNDEREKMGKLGRQKMMSEYQKSIVLEAYEKEAHSK